MFDQTFAIHDIAVVGLLIVLEGVLSIDNALVLGLLAKRLPRHLQNKALGYGLVGAFLFRLIAISMITLLFELQWVKLLGGLYLAFISLRHFVTASNDGSAATEPKIAIAPGGGPELVCDHAQEARELARRVQPIHVPLKERAAYQFWKAVMVIELTDIAFAVDSILAARGLVNKRDKTWVVITGGFLGVVLMRFAAAVFIKLLERFPRFETAAYLLVLLIGVKLVLDYIFNSGVVEHAPHLEFHDWHSPAFWVFWGLMLVCFCVGFVRRGRPQIASGS